MRLGLIGMVGIAWLAGQTILAAELEFTERVIGTGLNTDTSIWADDMNGDGTMDVIVGAPGNNLVHVYLNDGLTPAGFTHIELPYYIDAVRVRTADIDGDGDQDIAACSSQDDRVVWLENDGEDPPSFAQHVISSSTDRPADLEIADLNADGLLDVVSVCQNDGYIRWHRNLGGTPPSFSTTTIYPRRNWISGVDVADMDGDDDLDIVVAATLQHDIAIYYNSGGSNPSFSANVVMSRWKSYPGDVDTADLDEDGDMDIAAVMVEGVDTAYWYRNDGGREFTEIEVARGMDYPLTVQIEDMDLDGHLDIINPGLYDNTINIHYHSGDVIPTFRKQTIRNAGNAPREAIPVDLDADGDMDLLVATSADELVCWLQNDKQVSLELTKTFDKAAVTTGDTVICTLSVINHGPDTAESVTIQDPLPAGCHFIPYLSDARCVESNGVIFCELGDMEMGTSEDVEIALMIDAIVFDNIARVDSGVLDSFSNSATAADPYYTTYPFVKSIARPEESHSTTNSSTVDFLVTFSHEVANVDATDFVLQMPGTLDGEITDVQPAGPAAAYTVTVGNLSGYGLLRLDLVDDDSIMDAQDEALCGPADGSFDQGRNYMVDHAAPESHASIACHAIDEGRLSFYVMFAGSDAGAGIATTQLFYRRDAESAWQAVGDPVAQKYIEVDTEALPDGGAGLYEFYTVAVDGAGNAEAPPANADLTVIFSGTSLVRFWSAYE